MLVEIWSDVVCPWCYIGKRRFESAVAQFEAATDAKVEIRFRSYMLDPGAPIEGRPVREVYEKKFGGRDAADAILNRVTTEAANEGIEFNMDIAVRANTLSAHRLLVLAEQHGCQVALKERLMKAYFTEGVDIGDVEKLIEYGVDIGMDVDTVRSWLESREGLDEVNQSLDLAIENGFSGVPTYVVDRRMAIPGAQSVDTFVDILTKISTTSGPELFEGL